MAQHLLPLLLSFLSITALLSQTQKPLTTEDIIQMVRAGFQSSLIVKAIEANETAFDTSTQVLVALKEAGVSENILEAMLAATARKRSATQHVPPAVNVARGPSEPGQEPDKAAGVLSATSDPVNANPQRRSGAPGVSPGRLQSEPWPAEVSGIPREAGIYYQHGAKFIQLFGKPIVGTKTGGFLKASLTMGISKIRSKGRLPGKHAQLQVGERQPAFYFVMPEGQAPEGFSIIRMEDKGNRREFEVGSTGGATGGTASGLDVDKVYQLLVERVAAGLYRVRPERELRDGEYGFLGVFTYTAVGVAGAGERVYDFGVPKRR